MQDFSPIGTRYLNLFADRAFQGVYGSEPNKDITLSLLNVLLHYQEQIVDLQFVSTAHYPKNPADRGVVLDLHCKTKDGRRIVIELQKRSQKFFRERTLYYATYPIQAQGKRGRWNYDISAVYVVSILDFIIDPHSKDERVVTRKMILDTETHVPWTNKLVFINVEMPKFKKSLSECNTLLDKWFFVLKNLHRLSDKPSAFMEDVFCHLFTVTDKSSFEPAVRTEYEQSETEYGHMQNALDYAIEEGKAFGMAEGRAEGRTEGRTEGQTELVETMLRNGGDWKVIFQLTGFTQESFERMRSQVPH